MVEVIFVHDPIVAVLLFPALGGLIWFFMSQETKVTIVIKFCLMLLFFGLAGYAFHRYEYQEDVKKLKSEQSRLQEQSIRDDESGINKAVSESQEIILLRAELSADKKARKNLEAENKRLSQDLSRISAEYQAYRESADQTISKLKEENTQQKDKDNDKWLDFIHQ